MQFDHIYTQPGIEAAEKQSFHRYQAEDGREYVLPAGWDLAAAEVLIVHAFSKEPVPARLRAVPEAGVPEILWRRVADGNETAFETDIRDVIRRIAGAMTYGAIKNGIFHRETDAEGFYQELCYLFLNRIAAPETALWSFGFDWAYGLPPLKVMPADRLALLPEKFDPSSTPLSGLLVMQGDPHRHILKRVALLSDIQSLDFPEARMTVTLPVENVDSMAFISRRREAETDAVARDLGRRVMQAAVNRVMDACNRDALMGFDPAYNAKLKSALAEGRAAGVAEGVLQQAISRARQGFETFDLTMVEETDDITPFDTILSVPDDFVETAMTGHGFMMIDGGKSSYHAAAPDLLAKISESLWASGGPKIFFRDTAAAAAPYGKTTDLAPGGAGGFISPGGTGNLISSGDEFAPAAAINLLSCAAAAPALLDVPKLVHVVRILTVALSSCAGDRQAISIGAVNLPSWLMASGLAYDSDEGRAAAGLATAVISGAAYFTSAEMADAIGAFDGYAAMSKDYLQVIKSKIAALSGSRASAAGTLRRAQNFNVMLCADKSLVTAARDLWEKAYQLGREQGFRNSHLTAMAADTDLQAILGAATRNIMPESSLVRFEAQNNALYGKKMSAAAIAGLKRLGYKSAEIDDMHAYVVGHGTLLDAPGIDHKRLRTRGFSDEVLQRLDAALKTTQHLRYVFNEWTLGEGLESLDDLGFSEDEIDDANIYACGTLTLEGAPHLKPQHLAVFDCILPSGPESVRQVSAEAQVKMQAAVETFLSGAAVHTTSMNHHASIDDVQKILLQGWELGVKTMSIYRDASSLLHPMAVPEAGEEETTEENTVAAKRSA